MWIWNMTSLCVHDCPSCRNIMCTEAGHCCSGTSMNTSRACKLHRGSHASWNESTAFIKDMLLAEDASRKIVIALDLKCDWRLQGSSKLWRVIYLSSEWHGFLQSDPRRWCKCCGGSYERTGQPAVLLPCRGSCHRAPCRHCRSRDRSAAAPRAKLPSPVRGMPRLTQTVPPSPRAACRAAARPLGACHGGCSGAGAAGPGGERLVPRASWLAQAEPWNGLVGGNKGMWSLWF